MVLPVKVAPKVPDYKILEAIRQDGTPAYQQRIPKATQASTNEAINALLNNGPARNEFTHALMNRIARVIGRDISWSNPMAKFKIGMLEDGDTIEEIMTGLIKATKYDVNKDYLERDLYGQARPYVQSSFHKINRSDQYKFTLNDVELRKAFRSGDEFGLSNFIAQVMASANKSDQLDEYLMMMSLFRLNDENDGFFKVNVPNVGAANSTGEQGRQLLRSIRTYANNLQFISERYNAASMPVAANPEDLELFLTNEVDAALDVETLAGLFHADKADIQSRKTVAPAEHFGIEGFQAALSTRDFFVVADSHYEVAELPNPAGRYRNYWLQHDQIISLSRFAPTILFTTEPGTPIVIKDSTPTEITDPKVFKVSAEGVPTQVTTVERGSQYVVDADVTLDNEDGINDAVSYTLRGAESYDTHLDASQGLYVGEQETAESLTVYARAVGDPNLLVKSSTVTVVNGDRLALWPREGIVEDTGAGDTGEDGEDE